MPKGTFRVDVFVGDNEDPISTEFSIEELVKDVFQSYTIVGTDLMRAKDYTQTISYIGDLKQQLEEQTSRSVRKVKVT